MDFDDTSEEAAFRTAARAWLETHATYAPRPTRGPGGVAYDVDEARAWQRRLYDAGWAGITWPVEYGGRGGTAIQAAIFQEEHARLIPVDNPFRPAIGDAGRLIMNLGTPAQQAAHLLPVLRGEQIWCHLLSEPGAGSDLASLSTRAVRDGDDFVVNGQKVWTSYAHIADFGLLLARTNTDVPKHRGITYFIVDMRTPGIAIRPLQQMTGEAHFNEVFFDDARVPVSSVIGEIDKGWTIAHTSMANEREYVGNRTTQTRRFEHLAALAQQRGLNTEPAVRQRLANILIGEELLRYLWMRIQTAFSQGLPLRAEMSLLKLATSNAIARAAATGVDLMGPDGLLADTSESTEVSLRRDFLGYLAYKIGGGTDNMQKNAIAERILGLPREPRPPVGQP